MRIIKCQNIILEKHDNSERRQKQCNRLLGILTDAQIEALKTGPESSCVFRCPQCPPDERWVSVSYINNKIVFVVVNKPEVINELHFDEVQRTEMVG